MASYDRKALLVVKALMKGLVVEMDGYQWQILDRKLCVLTEDRNIPSHQSFIAVLDRASGISDSYAMRLAEEVAKGEKRTFIEKLLNVDGLLGPQEW